MKTRALLALALASFAFASQSLRAQVPDTLRHGIPALPVGLQTGSALGTSVAVDGSYAVVGAAYDDTGGSGSGVVKVFDSTTGALLWVIPNPGPAVNDNFGFSVAISGTRVVVGAWQDDTEEFNAGSAYVYDLASGTPTVPVATLNNPNPNAFNGFGWSVAIFGTRVVVGDAGSVHVYDLASTTPTVPVATLNNPSLDEYNYFGQSVAISGTRVVVGAYGDDTGATDAGSAYVYDLGSGAPTVPVATLNNPGPDEYDNFGFSVAISGTRVVVGAYGDDTGATDAGSAYVYDLGSGTPTIPMATLNNPSPDGYDNFGFSVAISGTRVVVGAYWDNTGATDAGSAYVYDLGSGTPTVPVATLNNPGPAADDYFGQSVAISGTWVVVGAPYDNTGATDAGSAYVYDLGSGAPTVPVATLNNPSPAADDNFGQSVAISGTWVVVGGPYDDTGARDAGSAYVYDLASATPTVPVATLNNPSPDEYDNFGWSVAISGTRVVVGALYDDTRATNAGSAYVYDLASATPTVPVTTLNNPSPDEYAAAFMSFGNSVAISGMRVVVGAWHDSTGAFDAGSAHVYDLGSGTPAVPVATLNNPDPVAFDWFGQSVAISGTRVVVGSPNAGSAYVYDLGSGVPTVPVATLNNPDPVGGDYFGYSVAISGTRVVVGAPYDDYSGAFWAGSAHVYDVGSGTPTVPVATLSNPSPDGYDYFGWAVAIDGTRVVVGEIANYGYSPDPVGAGGAYVYDVGSGTPTVPVAMLNNPSPATFNSFGSSVAIDGTTVAIGAPDDSTVVTGKGFAYVFAPADPDWDNDGLLDLWEYARFGSIAVASAGDDTDGDGRSELLEQAFDTDPLFPDVATGPAVVEGGYLTLTISKRAGVSYLGESAGSLEAGAFSAATVTIITNSATTLKVRDDFPMSGGGTRFLRMKVTAAP